jgi:hypothetical protein
MNGYEVCYGMHRTLNRLRLVENWRFRTLDWETFALTYYRRQPNREKCNGGDDDKEDGR